MGAGGRSPVRRLKSAGLQRYRWVRRARREAARRLRRARKHLRRGRYEPLGSLVAALYALGVPTLVPYELGARALAHLWSPRPVQLLLVRRFLRRHPDSPIRAFSEGRAAGDLRPFLAAAFLTRWRANALARCSAATLERMVSVEGSEHFLAARAEGRGVILAGSHGDASWCLPVALTRLGFESRPIGNPAFVRSFFAAPELVRFIVSEPGDKLMLRPLMEARKVLASGGSVLYLADGALGNLAIELPLLGGTQRFATGFAALARTTRAPMVPVTCRNRSDGGIAIAFHAQLAPPAAGGGREAQLEDLTRGYARFLEPQIRDTPIAYLGRDYEFFLKHLVTWDAAALAAPRKCTGTPSRRPGRMLR
jgi:KDO2-lipid IV(A) lauroyltransferase